MINQIIESFKNVSLRNKAVFTFKYQDLLLINAQPNNLNYQVVIESDPYYSFSGNVGTLTLNMSVMSFVNTSEVEIQDIASLIGLSIITKVTYLNRNILSLKDYSIYLFTKKSDDSCAGCRFTITFKVPEFIDYCTLEEAYLTDEEYAAKLEGMKGADLYLGDSVEQSALDLRPLKL